MCGCVGLDLEHLFKNQIEQNNTYKNNFVKKYYRYILIPSSITVKITEVVSHSFHLFSYFLKTYSPKETFNFFATLHHGAEDMGVFLSVVGFSGDLICIANGTYFKKIKHPVDCCYVAARVCHTTAHLLETYAFLHQLNLIKLAGLKNIVPYHVHLEALGFGLWAIGMIWDRHRGKIKDHFAINLSLHVAGCLSHGVLIARQAHLFKQLPRLQKYSPHIASIAALVQVSAYLNRVMSLYGY
jgi:hypothetical protein